MGYVLSAATADLYDEFLEAEKPKVSAQGYTTLSGIARRVLAWFEAEELDVARGDDHGRGALRRRSSRSALRADGDAHCDGDDAQLPESRPALLRLPRADRAA